MERYLIYKLNGLESYKIQNNLNFNVENDLIKKIFIDDNLKEIKVELQDNIYYEEKEDEIKKYINHVFFNLITQTSSVLKEPSIEIIKIKDGKISPLISITKSSSKFSISVQIEGEKLYNNITTSKTAINKHALYYERIFSILGNPNKVVQYISLYDFLMELLTPYRKNNAQRYIVSYFKEKYRNYSFIEFQLSRDPRKAGKNFKEDSFTFIRNEIAHVEDTNNLNLYKELGKKINDKIIRDLIKVINDVILEFN